MNIKCFLKLNSVSYMDIRRKFQIGLGIALIVITLLTNLSLWFPGIFMIAMGVFNFCPSCRNGACELPHSEKTNEENN